MNIIEPSKRMASCPRTVKTLFYKLSLSRCKKMEGGLNLMVHVGDKGLFNLNNKLMTKM